MRRKKITPLIFAAIIMLFSPYFFPSAKALTTNIRVGFNDGFGIYQSTDENGAAHGIHIDLMNAISEELSLSVEYVAFDNILSCYQALDSGEVDLVLGTPAGRIEGYTFLQVAPLSSYSLCLIADNETAENGGTNNSYTGQLIAIGGEHLKIIMNRSNMLTSSVLTNNLFSHKGSQQAALDALISGSASLAICERENAIHYLRDQGVSELYTIAINYLDEIETSILVREENPVLYNQLVSILPNLRARGVYDDILKKWLSPTEFTLSSKVQRIIFISSLLIGGAIALYVFISVRMRRQLALQVEARTKELRQTNEVLADKMGQLRQENELRNNIVQNSVSAMIIYDWKDEVSFLNQQAMQLIGVNDITEVKSNASSLPIFGPLLKIIKKMQTSYASPEAFPLVVGGETRLFRCTHYLLPADSEEKKYLFSVEDVTKEESEKKARFEKEKNRLLNNIITGIAHEIKNPLAAISAFAELIPTQSHDHEFMETFSQLVPMESERITNLIETLVDYASPPNADTSVINLAELANHCITLTASLAHKVGIKAQLKAEDQCLIQGNGDHIQQALINYLINAIDAIQARIDNDTSKPVPGLCVFVYAVEQRVFLEVYDEGIGMDEHSLEQCMDPFYTTKAKGTGLGMAMALQAIRESNGVVRLESVKGSFTRVTIEFERYQV